MRPAENLPPAEHIYRPTPFGSALLTSYTPGVLPLVKLITLHAFRGGTGKTNIAANLATQLAMRGRRVGLIDADLTSPGLHVLLGLDLAPAAPTLNDYLWERAAIRQAAYPVAPEIGGYGSLYLIPASLRADDITRVLREGYDISLLYDGCQELVTGLALNFLILDTQPGLNEEALLCAGISDLVLVVLRPEQQDLAGTAILLDIVRRKFDIPHLMLAINMLPDGLDAAEVRAQAEQACGADVAAALPLSHDVAKLGSGGLFSTLYPDHPWSQQIGLLADRILRL